MNDSRKAQFSVGVVHTFLDDARRLIEAGKVRGREVFELAVAINLLLTALFAPAKSPITPYPSCYVFNRLRNGWVAHPHYACKLKPGKTLKPLLRHLTLR